MGASSELERVLRNIEASLPQLLEAVRLNRRPATFNPDFDPLSNVALVVSSFAINQSDGDALDVARAVFAQRSIDIDRVRELRADGRDYWSKSTPVLQALAESARQGRVSPAIALNYAHSILEAAWSVSYACRPNDENLAGLSGLTLALSHQLMGAEVEAEELRQKFRKLTRGAHDKTSSSHSVSYIGSINARKAELKQWKVRLGVPKESREVERPLMGSARLRYALWALAVALPIGGISLAYIGLVNDSEVQSSLLTGGVVLLVIWAVGLVALAYKTRPEETKLVLSLLTVLWVAKTWGDRRRKREADAIADAIRRGQESQD